METTKHRKLFQVGSQFYHWNYFTPLSKNWFIYCNFQPPWSLIIGCIHIDSPFQSVCRKIMISKHHKYIVMRAPNFLSSLDEKSKDVHYLQSIYNIQCFIYKLFTNIPKYNYGWVYFTFMPLIVFGNSWQFMYSTFAK